MREVLAKKSESSSVAGDELSEGEAKIVSSGKSEVKAEQRTSDEELSDGELEIAEKERLDGRWFIIRLIKGKVNSIHLQQALGILIPREYVSRERSRRHIASEFLSDSKEIDENDNVLLFSFCHCQIAVKKRLSRK